MKFKGFHWLSESPIILFEPCFHFGAHLVHSGKEKWLLAGKTAQELLLALRLKVQVLWKRMWKVSVHCILTNYVLFLKFQMSCSQNM